MSGIRVTYSGLISFVIGIFSVFTGLIFTLIVTRELTQNEFGTWSLIGGLISYVLVFGPIVSYWTTREIARGEDSGKTAILSSGFFSIIGLLIFIAIAFLFGTNSEADKDVLIFASILVPLELIRNVLLAINHGYKPQTGEYGLFAFEIAKIPLAFLFVFSFEMGLTGAILSVAIAYIASISVLAIRSREKIKGRFQVQYLKKWLRLFWLPSYPNLKLVLTQTDVVIFTLLTGSVEGLAFWGAARAISVIVHHAQKISKGLYPKLVGGGKKEFLQENFTRVLYFGFPLVIMSIVFAEPALFTLNPLYQQAFLVVVFFAPVIFLRTIGNVFTQSLTGVEKVDVRENSSFMDYLRSKLFYIPTLIIMQRASYLIALSVMLLLFRETTTELNLVIYWSIVGLLTQIPFTLYFYILVKREFPFKIEIKQSIKYLFSSIMVFGIIFYIMENSLVYTPSIFDFLPQILGYVIVAILGYVGLTYVIDNRTRKLCSSIINEIKNVQKR